MSYDQKFLIAMEFSLASEILVLLILNRLLKLKKRPTDVLFAGFLATFSSIIYLWYILPNYLSGINYLIIGELLVLLFETVVLKKLLQVNWLTALLLSFTANLVSFSLGWIVL